MSKNQKPVDTVAKCKRCGGRLGSQDPVDTCGACRFVADHFIFAVVGDKRRGT